MPTWQAAVNQLLLNPHDISEVSITFLNLENQRHSILGG